MAELDPEPEYTFRIVVDPAAPVGTIVGAEVEGAELAVIRHARGWTVTARECPHAQCSLVRDGEVADDTVLICNCHGSEFDLLTGDVLLEPAESPLEVLDAQLSDDGSYLTVRV